MNRTFRLFSHLVVLFTVVLSASCKSKSEKAVEQVGNEIVDITTDMRSDLQDELNEGGLTGEAYEKSAEKMSQSIKKAEQSATGTDAERLNAMGIYIEIAQKDSKILNDKTDEFIALLDYSKLKSVEDIDRVIEGAKEFEQLNKDMIPRVETGWFKELRETCKKEKISEQVYKEVLAGVRPPLVKQLPTIKEIRACDIGMCQEVTKQMLLLKETFGS